MADAIRHPQKRAFLAAYRQSGNIRASTEAAGVQRTTFYQWTESDLVFAAAARQAKEEFGDLLEAKLSQMAMRQDNVTALIVALKMAGRFTERARVEITLRQQAEKLALSLGLDVDELVAEAGRIVADSSA